jgi:hypothetical protein
MMQRPKIAIVTPALASANNGNWQTARRWARFLSRDYQVRLTDTWHCGDEAIMIALHARRSAASIAAWHLSQPRRPLVVVLTGTDLYRDIDTDAAAKEALRMARRRPLATGVPRQGDRLSAVQPVQASAPEDDATHARLDGGPLAG